MTSWRNLLERIKTAFSPSRTRFVRKYLDPADRLEEVLCGLIMVLDFTLIARADGGRRKTGSTPSLDCRSRL